MKETAHFVLVSCPATYKTATNWKMDLTWWVSLLRNGTERQWVEWSKSSLLHAWCFISLTKEDKGNIWQSLLDEPYAVAYENLWRKTISYLLPCLLRYTYIFQSLLRNLIRGNQRPPLATWVTSKSAFICWDKGIKI